MNELTTEQAELLDGARTAWQAALDALQMPYEPTAKWWDDVALSNVEAKHAVDIMSPDKFDLVNTGVFDGIPSERLERARGYIR